MKRTTHIAAIALIGLSGLAIAGPDGKQSDRQDDKQTLRGPRVHQNAPADRSGDAMGERSQRGERGQRPDRAGGEMRAMMGAMRALNRAEGDLAVTDEQREQIKKIVEEQRAAMKAFMEEHKAEIEKIKAEAKAQRVEGERPDPEVRKAAMAKVKKIMEGAPADGEAKKKIMGVLSEGQQALVKETMAKQRKRMEGRRERGQDRAEKRQGQRGAEGEDGQRRQRRGERGAEGKQKRERPAPVDD